MMHIEHIYDRDMIYIIPNIFFQCCCSMASSWMSATLELLFSISSINCTYDKINTEPGAATAETQAIALLLLSPLVDSFFFHTYTAYPYIIISSFLNFPKITNIC